MNQCVIVGFKEQVWLI